MRSKWAVLICILALAGLAGCGSSSDGDATAQQVAAYKAAVPDSQDLLVASAPEAAAPRAAAAVGEAALYPPLAIEVVPQVNGIVTNLIDTMQTIVNAPYNIYDPQEQMVLWGPFPNDDGAGQIVVVISKEEPTVDDPFEYIFVLLRVADEFTFTNLDDLANETVVIFGGAAPDGAEGPAGLAVFDFDANAAFAQAQGELGTFTTGGFATAFGRAGPDAELDGVLHLVIAAFRDFVPEDAPSDPPVNVDYLYGNFVPTAAPLLTVDFMEFDGQADAEENASNPEALDIRMAFINRSEGRAEVTAQGGDLPTGITANAVECWDSALRREYFSYQESGGGALFEDGEVAFCGSTFSQTLDQLQIPSLASITADDPDILPLLADLAIRGWAAVGE